MRKYLYLFSFMMFFILTFVAQDVKADSDLTYIGDRTTLFRYTRISADNATRIEVYGQSKNDTVASLYKAVDAAEIDFEYTLLSNGEKLFVKVYGDYSNLKVQTGLDFEHAYVLKSKNGVFETYSKDPYQKDLYFKLYLEEGKSYIINSTNKGAIIYDGYQNEQLTYGDNTVARYTPTYSGNYYLYIPNQIKYGFSLTVNEYLDFSFNEAVTVNLGSNTSAIFAFRHKANTEMRIVGFGTNVIIDPTNASSNSCNVTNSHKKYVTLRNIIGQDGYCRIKVEGTGDITLIGKDGSNFENAYLPNTSVSKTRDIVGQVYSDTMAIHKIDVVEGNSYDIEYGGTYGIDIYNQNGEIIFDNNILVPNTVLKDISLRYIESGQKYKLTAKYTGSYYIAVKGKDSSRFGVSEYSSYNFSIVEQFNLSKPNLLTTPEQAAEWGGNIYWDKVNNGLFRVRLEKDKYYILNATSDKSINVSLYYFDGSKVVTEKSASYTKNANLVIKPSTTKDYYYYIEYGQGQMVYANASNGLTGKEAKALLKELGFSWKQRWSMMYDPVDTSSGALIVDKTLLKYESTNPLEFDIHYNSLLTTKGSLGNGWYHPYGINVKTNTDGTLTVNWDQNHSNVFSLSQGTVYTSNVNSMKYNKLEKTSTGFLFTFQDGEKLYFNTSGQLIKQLSKTGDELTFTYSSNKLQKITQTATGHSFTFTYTSDLISKIVDNSGKEVTFKYQDNNLIEININGNIEKFTYNTDYQILTGTNAENIIYMRNIYDGLGRVYQQFDSYNNVSTLEYSDINDNNEIITKTTNREGHTRTLVHDINYQLIEIIDENGKKQSFSYDSNGNQIKAIDANGNPTYMTYNDSGNMKTVTNALGKVTRYEYDEHNNVISMTEVVKDEEDFDVILNQIIYTYNNSNQITSVTDGRGNTTYNEYTNGLLTKKIDADGNVTLYTYQNGLLKTIKNPDGGMTLYEYTTAGLVSKVTYPEENTEKFTYDKFNNILSKIDAYENSKVYTYNKSNQVLSFTDEMGYVETYEYTLNGKVKKVSKGSSFTEYTYNKEDLVIEENNSLNQKKITEYDGLGQVIREVDESANEYLYTYSPTGNVLTETLNGQYVTSYEYDELGRNTKTINPELQEQTFIYDLTDNVIETKSFEGYITKYTFDENKNVLSEEDGLGRVISNSYDFSNNLKGTIDANGNETLFYYDPLFRLIQVVNPLGETSSYSYDKNGNLLQSIDNSKITIREYDLLNRQTKVIDAENQSLKYVYDLNSNLIEKYDAKNIKVYEASYNEFNQPVVEKDALNNSVQNIFDSEKNLIKTIDELNREQQLNRDNQSRVTAVIDKNQIESTQNYDALNKITSFSDPNQNTTLYVYNKLGQLLEETNAAGGKIQYQYNAQGLLDTVINGRGQETKYEYNAIGSIVKVSDNEGIIEYTYDNNDNILSVSENGNISSTYTYDALNRVISYTDEFNNTIRYEYENGRLSNLIYPDNKVVHYEYNNVDLLTSVTDWNGNVTRYIYDDNNLVLTELPNGSQEVREYNINSQLTLLKNIASDGSIISSEAFTYDSVGNVLTEGIKSFTYDNLDRVTSSNEHTYDYDNGGNILTVTGSTYNAFDIIPTVTSVTYNVYGESQFTYGPDNRLISINGQTLNYDVDGNLINIPLNNELLDATYDSRNRLTSLGNYSYTYNAENQRTSSLSDNGLTIRYIYNPNSELQQLLMETDEYGNPIAYYVYGLGLISKEDVSGNIDYYHYDRRGSTVALTDEYGIVNSTYKYDDFGEILERPENDTNQFLFNGRYGVMTDDSGLYHMKSRYYNPEIKRFINRDVVAGNILNPQSLNRYAYANGNPVSYLDPFGTSAMLDKIQLFLDGAGFIPGIGIAADILNGVIYAARGDYLSAGLSLGAAVPLIGDVAAAAKLASKGTKALRGVEKAEDAYELTKLGKICNCFTSSTKVITSKGEVNIEDIQLGDKVLSKDDVTGEQAYKEVINLFRRTTDETYTIVIGNEEITTTAYHPFYVKDKGWVIAKDLINGDLLEDENGQYIKIDDIIISKELNIVYNFEVEDFHTYYVSNLGIWTHNITCPINGKQFQDHHIISDKNQATKNHDLITLSGFNLQSQSNKIYLPTEDIYHPTRSIHKGRHTSAVSENLAQEMDIAVSYGKNNNWTQADYDNAIRNIIKDERQLLRSGDRALNKNKRSWAK